LLTLVATSAVIANPSETAILPPEQPWDGASRNLALPADHEWATPCERSGLLRTPRYAETVAWLQKLAEAAPQLNMVSLGKSAEGRDIWMVVASREGAADAPTLKKNGRPTFLAHAGIHSGEIDGKDAGMMLLRDMTVLGKQKSLLDGANFLFVPILSVDAHERFSRYSRMNQRGPVESGWRTNGRNLNLNRDYAKLETEELQALVAAVVEWQPDLYMDLHVTDGVDYQYDVTYGYNGPHGWSPAIATWLDEVFSPAVNAGLEKMGHVPGPLTFGANRRDMTAGNYVWTAPPRFSNGWGDARHLPTVLVENHSLKSYPRRVLGTYVMLQSALSVLGENGDSLREAVARDRRAGREEIPLGWQAETEVEPPVRPFKAIRSELEPSPVTGVPQVRWTGEPVELEIPFVQASRPTLTARRPRAYYIPAAWYPIADRLRLQGIEVERLESALKVEVEQLRLPDAELDAENSPYEGRALFTSGEPVVERREVTLASGSFRVDTGQPLGTLAVLLLEPQSYDSLFRWGYFAEVLQRTEYFESYVMEPMARAMLDADPDLKAEFEQKLLNDADFAGSARARLEWFYEKTPFYDKEYRLYPVSRSLD
jgi:hypothetical protein